MAERDRVFDAFRNCITEPKCKDCPWTECETIDHGTIEIPRNLALAVMRELAAQEPRVMTIQEVARCSMCWLEDESVLVPALFIGMEKRANGEKCDVFLAVKPDNDNCEFWYNIDEYGVTWRCWTSRPTEEQREATPWIG